MWKYASSLVCGIAIGVIIDRIIQCIKENQKLKYTKVLEDCFGEPMFTNSFGISDVRDWSKAREELLNANHKIVVMKALPSIIKDFVDGLEIGKGLDNYLIMAVVNEENKTISESMLIKYEKLDAMLEEQLNKGNGSMVVGG